MICVFGCNNRKINNNLLSKAREIRQNKGKEKEEILLLFLDGKEKKIHRNYYADKVVLLQEKKMEMYDPEVYATAATDFLKEQKSLRMLLFPSVLQWRETAAALSIRLRGILFADCIDLWKQEDTLYVRRPEQDGDQINTYRITENRLFLILIKSTSRAEYDVGSSGKSMGNRNENTALPAEGYNLTEEISGEKNNELDEASGLLQTEKVQSKSIFVENDSGMKQTSVYQKEEQGSSVNDAKLIFSGGRGMQSAEAFCDLRALAHLYGGAVGGSRPVVDRGWASVQEQIGQTGQFVHPRVYLAFGISGAVQHLAGMRESDVIIAINNNRNSPIYHYCDYGIQADANSIIRNMLHLLREHG